LDPYGFGPPSVDVGNLKVHGAGHGEQTELSSALSSPYTSVVIQVQALVARTDDVDTQRTYGLVYRLLAATGDDIHSVVVSFRVRNNRGEMYIGHRRLCVCLCLSVCPSSHSHALLHRPGCNLG